MQGAQILPTFALPIVLQDSIDQQIASPRLHRIRKAKVSPVDGIAQVTPGRRQGQLERTVRHEMVHALIDGALASKPMWVREGAAIYFSRSPAVGRQPAERVPCPSDAEVLRPISAGAQRDAYARAEACFARQINSGRRWEDVR